MDTIDKSCYKCEFIDTYGCDECYDESEFQLRSDIVELQGKLRKALDAIEEHRKFYEPQNAMGSSYEKLWNILEELR